MAEFIGTTANDNYSGGESADIIVGNGGSDQLFGLAGWDIIFSGARNAAVTDPYDAPINAESLDKTGEADVLAGGDFDDLLFAGYNDSVDGGSQVGHGDVLYISFQGATTGVNADFRQLDDGGTMTIGLGVYKNIENIGYLEGSNFDDTLVLMSSQYLMGVHIYGAGGNDNILASYNSGFGDSALYGGDGNDVIDGRPAQYSPRIFGEAGDDTLYGSGGLTDGGTGNDTIYGYEDLHGGAGADHIFIDTGTAYGDAGNDDIHGTSVGFVGYGGTGADKLFGSSSSDILFTFDKSNDPFGFDQGIEKDQVSAGAGNDFVSVGIGDSADGGEGDDSLALSLATATAGITLSTSFFTPSASFEYGSGTYSNFEKLAYLQLSQFSDKLTIANAGGELDMVLGEGGNDTFITQAASARLFGGAGNDRLISGVAADMFDGGVGNDTVDYSKYSSAVKVVLNATEGLQGSGPGNDTIFNVENIVGSGFNDTLAGSNVVNSITGNDGDDTIGGAGGNDKLIGGAGNDALNGGRGADRMAGGTGADRFVFRALGDSSSSASDTITDFDGTSGDRIDLAAIDANSQIAGNQAFAFIGTAAFGKLAGQLRYSTASTTTTVEADCNGDGVADLVVILTGSKTLVEQHFLL